MMNIIWVFITEKGGGILIQYWSPRIRFNIIRDNEAHGLTVAGLTSAGGGAIRCGDGNPLIENNIVISYSVTEAGMAVE